MIELMHMVYKRRGSLFLPLLLLLLLPLLLILLIALGFDFGICTANFTTHISKCAWRPFLVNILSGKKFYYEVW